MVALKQSLACHETDRTYENAQDRSPHHIHHRDQHRPVFQRSEVGQVVGGIGDQAKQGRPQQGGFERTLLQTGQNDEHQNAHDEQQIENDRCKPVGA